MAEQTDTNTGVSREIMLGGGGPKATTTRLRLAGGQIMCLYCGRRASRAGGGVVVSCFWARAAASYHAIGGGPLFGMQVGK